MPEQTVGATGAENTGSESAAAKSASPGSGADDSGKGVEARIEKLTGELGRKNELLENLRKQVKDLEEKTKTEDDKRIEQIAQERFGPQIKRAEALEQHLTKERDQLMKLIPDEHKGLVLTGEHIPVEQQIEQARGVLGLLKKDLPQSFTSGGAPSKEQPKRDIPRAEYEAWSRTLYTDPKAYDAKRPEMLAAMSEGRVK